MNYKIILLLAVLGIQQSYAQLNCKTITNKDSVITICYHTNSKPSSVEAWDGKRPERRWGTLKVYDKKGGLIYKQQIRNVAGHASVYLSYHKNGQVSKAEYSSQPDGGIQRYHNITEFDENGNKTNFQDLSWPDGHPTTITELYKTNPAVVTKESPKQETVECAAIHITEFVLINETKHAVKLSMKYNKKNQYIQRTDKEIVLKGKQTLKADSITFANRHFDLKETYSVELNAKQLKNKKFRLIEAAPAMQNGRKIYTWHILE